MTKSPMVAVAEPPFFFLWRRTSKLSEMLLSCEALSSERYAWRRWVWGLGRACWACCACPDEARGGGWCCGTGPWLLWSIGGPPRDCWSTGACDCDAPLLPLETCCETTIDGSCT